MFSIREIIDIAIQLEKNGEKLYRHAVHLAVDDTIRGLLEWMADEELRHIEWFSELKNEADKSEDDLFDKDMSRALIDEVIKEQIFSLKDADFSKIKDVDRLVDIFIEFEEDTFLFYEMLKPFLIGVEDLHKLEQIMDEEKLHIKKLQKLRSDGRASVSDKSR